MKRLLTILILAITGAASAQPYNMCVTSSTIDVSGTLFDSGGPSADYSDSENCGFLIDPGCATSITLNFSFFDVESGWDFLNVYDGTDNTGTQILVDATGNSLPASVTANSGSMYIEFTSDGIISAPGFEANWSSVIGSQSPVAASFTPSNSNPGYQQPVTFTDGSSSSPTVWSWDFGDGNTSSLQNPTHIYSGSGTYTVTLIASNCSFSDTTSQSITVQTPNFSVNPDTVFMSLSCGAPGAGTVTFYNNDTTALEINVENSGGLSGLDTVLARVNRKYASITSLVPSLFQFSDGDVGNNISDGGNDMYDGGNYINTNITSAINYSDNVITSSTDFGANGAYFTRKVPGLFVLGADIDNLSTFSITGNLGADGSGNSDGAVISRTVNGSTYTGFINRTFNAGDPSINRLIIVKDNPAATHTFLTNTDDEDHEVSNLNGGVRIYYLMFAADNGLYIDDVTIGNVMDEFLNLLDGGAALSFTPNADTVAAADSSVINFSIDITGLLQGTYERTILINILNPYSSYIEVPVIMDISGTATIVLSDTCITFPQLLTKEVLFDTVTYTNGGCDTLNINGISFNNTDYTLVSQSGDILPGQTGQIIVQFRPTTAGSITGDMTIQTNIGNSLVCLSGIGLAPPITFGSHPDTLYATIPCGGSFDTTFVIYNSHSDSLSIDLPSVGGETTLDTILARVNRNYTSITSLVSPLFLFSNGDIGNNISDGGNDMYDGGNYINTNITSAINYSDNVITSSTSFGANGAYFTRKVPGLFVLGADIDNLSTFSITGNLGADGSGNSDGAVISRTVSGITYTGFINRTYNAGDPSINRLIIVVNNPAATHTFLTATLDEDHRALNLNAGSRIYYLMFAGTGGVYFDDAVMGNVMDAFLDLLNSGPSYTFTPNTATIASGDSIVITANIDITGLYQGTYDTDISVNTGSPFNYTFVYPAVIDVIGTAEIVLSDTCINFPTAVGGNPIYDTIFYTNTGCDTLQISSATIADPNFTIDSLTGDLLPGQSGAIVIAYNPVSNGAVSSSLMFTTNVSSDAICLTGTGQNIAASFSVSGQNPCTAAITFTDQTTAADTLTSWLWDFGDGLTSTQQNPLHTYAATGMYTVTLVSCYTGGCDTTQQTVVVNSLFQYSISVSGSLTTNQPLSFDIVGPNVLSVTWDFGDGTSLPSFPVNHAYTDSGTYTITASVLTSGPCFFDVQETVTITDSGNVNVSELISNAIYIYPNPSKGNMMVRNEAFNGDAWHIELVNTLGEAVYVQQNIVTSQKEISTELEAGVYTLFVHTRHGRVGQKRIVITK